MTTDNIYFRFRGQDRKAYLHKHINHTTVYLSDQDLITDFGGAITFEAGGVVSEPKNRLVPDLKDLHRVIAAQLK